MKPALAVLLAVTTVCAGIVTPAHAESPYERVNSHEYAWLGTGLALCVGGFLGAKQVDPLTPAAIDALNRDDINSFERNSMQPYRADHAGDAMVAASFLLPLGAALHGDARHDTETIGLMWVEAAMWNAGLNYVVKAAATRTRPYVYDPNAPDDLKTAADARFSFYSGHTALASMNAVFAAKVFSDYSSNRNAEIAVWSGAVVYSALTGFFRVDSGHHFTTDAIAGFVAGGAIGYLVPELHHRDSNLSVTPETGSGGFAMAATFSF